VIDVDDGCVQYADGWNDARIAGRLKVSTKVIANTRNNTFGKLCGQPLTTQQQVAAIEDRLSKIELFFENDFLKAAKNLHVERSVEKTILTDEDIREGLNRTDSRVLKMSEKSHP
tara:strand:+ start:250 stop:594 length:345 start_codon:yes stop_codon:yes gene_type:complete